MSRTPTVPYEEVVAEYRKSGSAREAAAKFGLSDQSIYTALRALGQTVIPRSSKRTVTDEQIIEAYRRLGDGNKVAKELHTNSVYAVLKKHGIEADGLKKYRARARKIDDAGRSRVIAEYEAGKSAAQLAREFGCVTEVILRILKQSSIKIRSPKPHMTETEKDEARRLYESGMNFNDVAAATGRSTGTITRIINTEFPESVRSDSIGPGSPHFRGGTFVDSQGYVQEWISLDDPLASMARKPTKANGRSSYAPQHRLVLARKLGRPLLPTETVHHLDGNRQNNDPANVELREGRHGKHIVTGCGDCGSRNLVHFGIGQEPKVRAVVEIMKAALTAFSEMALVINNSDPSYRRAYVEIARDVREKAIAALSAAGVRQEVARPPHRRRVPKDT